MKIIFSRKGFDSSSGGYPSPIIKDSNIMISIPIPDEYSGITYDDLSFENETDKISYGDIVEDLTKMKITKTNWVHLDPDLNKNIYKKRVEDWKSIFGQCNAAQSHLENQEVNEGDIFIFFGLFREVEKDNGRFKYIKDQKPIHVMFGWLQIDKILKVDEILKNKNHYKWALSHPHLQDREKAFSKNTIYVGKDKLNLDGLNKDIPGAGYFKKFDKSLQLTDNNSDKVSYWNLPSFFYPERDRKPLTYHKNMSRWEKHNDNDNDYVLLKTVGRGQEFVLDTNYYPETIGWTKDIFEKNIT